MEMYIILGLIIGILAILFINFTTVESGNYKFVVKGETYKKTIDPAKNWSLFGWFWIGLSFLYTIYIITINKYKVNPDRNPKDPKTWVTHEDGVKVNTLRKVVTIPIVMEQVELKDKTKVDFLLNVILEFKIPFIFIFLLKGNFRPIISIITSKINDRVKTLNDIKDFILTDKGEGSDFFKEFIEDLDADNKSILNQLLLTKSGSIVTGLNISDFKADEALVEALNQKAIEELKAEALSIKADADANYKSKQAVADIDSLITRLQNTGASPAEVLKALTDLKRSQSIEKTTTTTLVLGGSTGTNINT